MGNLSYHVPTLGKLNAVLFPVADKCYRLLKSQGQIERLKEIAQLGHIRDIFQGAHHSRWEYVMLQLAITSQLATTKEPNSTKPAVGLGLGSKVTEEVREATGADVLQVWAMLLNSAHLPGTFASERAIMIELKNDPVLRGTFRRGLPDKDSRDLLTSLLDKERVFSFHRVLALFMLARWRRSSPKLTAELISLLKLYAIESDSTKVVHLRNVFKRIRELAYLFLDSQYVPLPVHLQLGSIMSNWSEHVNPLFRQSNSAMVQTLNALDRILEENVYLSSYAMLAGQLQEEHVLKLIAEEAQREPKWHRSVRAVRKFLYGSAIDLPHHPELDNLVCLRLWIEDVDKFGLSESAISTLRPLELQRHWETAISRSVARIAVVRSPADRALVISVGIVSTANRGEKARVVAHTITRLCALHRRLAVGLFEAVELEQSLTGYFANRILSSPATDLLLFALGQLCSNGRVQFAHGPSQIKPWYSIVCRGSCAAASAIEKDVKPDSTASRQNEVNVLKLALRDVSCRGSVLLTTEQVQVTCQGKPVTDIDGCAMFAKRGKLLLLLSEAKDQVRSGSGDSKRRLESTLTELGLNGFKIIGLGNKGAYAMGALG